MSHNNDSLNHKPYSIVYCCHICYIIIIPVGKRLKAGNRLIIIVCLTVLPRKHLAGGWWAGLRLSLLAPSRLVCSPLWPILSAMFPLPLLST
ncbi:uncharacterized protein BDV17DRAFT_142 [Aspergillus undulatus]|uniref:uncharacterized protein n=1 Tax=Aspergillus undulatus TaxID=1810928 RepID=UPI003CCE26FD